MPTVHTVDNSVLSCPQIKVDFTNEVVRIHYVLTLLLLTTDGQLVNRVSYQPMRGFLFVSWDILFGQELLS